MTVTATVTPDQAIARILTLRSPTLTVLVDGPSGAGKSRFADGLAAAWPEAQLVRLDDVYPGWSGLDAASADIVADALAPRAAGEPAGWRRWDWAAYAPAEWHVLAPDRPLIVEGCGSLSRAAAPLSDLRVWLTADEGVRKRRAIERDAGGFDAHWDMWEGQWQAYVRREQPERSASIRVAGG